MARRDIPPKVTGGAAYVQDIRLPGMVHARVVRPALSRPRLLEANVDAAKAMPGVLAVVRDGNFLAVAAQREEQAIAASRALAASAKWEPMAPLPPTGAALFTMMKSARAEDSVIADKNPGAAVPAGATQLAEYTRPYQAHGSIGPSCAVAQWDEGKLQVWCHSQGVFPLRADMAKALRLRRRPSRSSTTRARAATATTAPTTSRSMPRWSPGRCRRCRCGCNGCARTSSAPSRSARRW
jgi:nicotinate dehydrogenase subunit B